MDDPNKIENIFDNLTDDEDLEKAIVNAKSISHVDEENKDDHVSPIKTKIKDKINKKNNKDSEEDDVEYKEPELTPLQKMIKKKETDIDGIVFSDEELEKGHEGFKDIIHNEDRIEDWDKRELEMDSFFKKRAALVQTKDYKTQIEYAEMVKEVEDVVFTFNGAEFAHPETIKYFRIRTKDDPEYTAQDVANGVPSPESIAFSNNLDEETKKSLRKENNNDSNNNAELSTITDEDDPSPNEPEVDKNMIQVIIDKTGLGTDFAFTEEERSKIQQVETIQVNELKVVDIAAVKAKKSKKSFQDVVKERDLSGNRVKIAFPGSGFRAEMKGLTYGEYADVALGMDNITVDQTYKRLSIIYNKMTNISCGPFDNFEDFLHKFAYVDIPLALYAIYVATEPEVTDISLRCTRPNCGQNYGWKFSPRSILRLDSCSAYVRENLSKILSAYAADFDDIAEESDVRQSKYVELPNSKYIIEIGLASAYEYIYNLVPVINEDNFREEFGDIFQDYMDTIVLLTTIRNVRVPDEDGTYILCENYKDIINAIYTISPEEIQILTAYTIDLQEKYSLHFSLGKVVCPHCGAVTQDLEVTVDEMVFRTYSRLLNTRVKLKTTQD